MRTAQTPGPGGDTDGIPLPWKLKGHALERSWSGKQGASNARGQCECGWYFKGWTNQMASVVMSHRSHLRREKLSAQSTPQPADPSAPTP
jgi:hypothetical protein